MCQKVLMCCASWCPTPCRRPETYADAKRLCDMHGAELHKVDIDRPGAWGEFTETVTSVPTFIVVRSNLSEVGRIVGVDTEGLRRMLEVTITAT